MLQIFLDFEFMARYFVLSLLLPLVLFLALILLFWYIQSWLVLRTYYRIVLPELRRNRISYWLVGGAAVASHELLGHALVGAATGSETELQRTISPESGEVKISHRRSAWGYLSAILATLAPCFAPPLIVLLAFAVFFPGLLALSSFDPASALATLLSNFLAILGAVFNSDLTNPANLLFIYLLAALSLTAGASRADFHVVFDSTKQFWYFAAFLILAFAAGLEVLRAMLQMEDIALLFYPIASLLVLSSLTVLLGLFISLALALFLRNMREFGHVRKLIAFLSLPLAYIVLIYTPLPLTYPAILFVSVFFGVLVQFALKLLNPYVQKPGQGKSLRIRRGGNNG